MILILQDVLQDQLIKKKLVKIIQKNDLRNLTVDEVLDCLRNDFRYEL